MPFHIVHDDITRMQVDAIVNAANEGLRRGGGVCGAIFAAAGARELQAACDAIGHCSTGSAVATPAFRLPAKHVIHAVGPVWRGGRAGEEQALRGCYRTALGLARELGDASIAFPLISAGIYGYPKEQAVDVALEEIRTFLDAHDMDVYLSIFDAAAQRASSARFADVAAYLATHAAPDDESTGELCVQDQPAPPKPVPPKKRWGARKEARRSSSYEDDFGGTDPFDFLTKESVDGMASYGSMPAAKGSFAAPYQDKRTNALEQLLSNMDEPFSVTLMRMIDERGLKDSEVYKRANISRQHFSKIRSNPDYKPKKQTVLAFAVALELTVSETKLLLERAGLALTHANKRDMIVEYYLQNHIYDIFEINHALYYFQQPLLD